MNEFHWPMRPTTELAQLMALNNSKAADPRGDKAVSVANAVIIDRVQAEQFAGLLFDGMSGWVNLRGIREPADSRGPTQKWVPIDAGLPKAVGDFVQMCAANGFAAYLLPHPVQAGEGGLKGILSQRVLPIDIDGGDIAAKASAISAALGDPWLTVQSGGIEAGQPKLHLYYRLAADVGPTDFARLAELRAEIAQRFGADTKVGKNPAQILRIAGSLHRKVAITPRLCVLDAINSDARVKLDGVASALGLAGAVSNIVPFSLDFLRDRPVTDMDRVLLPTRPGSSDRQ